MSITTSHQQRQLVESSRSGTLSTHVKQRAYNLRPRKDDPVTMQRRSEFARLREQQNQRRNKRKEVETLKEISEYMEYLRKKGQKLMEIQPETSDEDSENITSEVITGDTSGKTNMGGWRPYFEASDSGLFKTTLKGASWAVEQLALQGGASVVGLQSFTGKTYLFSCSGTIVQFFEESNMIVTVANLVKCPDADEVADNLKIYVYLLQNHKTLEGVLSYHDFYHNICVIRVQSPVHLPEKRFSSNMEAINFDKTCSREVVTLGHDKENHALLVTTGKIVPKSSKFDCDELSVSTCRISKVEVGGPLMDFDGNFIGMNFYHAKETPFLPSFIVLKCLQQFKLFRKVVRPWHGLRVRTLHAEGSIAHEKMLAIHGVTGVIIEKLGGILLDIGTMYLMDNPSFDHSDSNKMAICIKFGVRGCKQERTIVVDKLTSGALNKWPFPKPIIVRTYVRGRLEDEEWYAQESSSQEFSQESSSRESSPCSFLC